MQNCQFCNDSSRGKLPGSYEEECENKTSMDFRIDNRIQFLYESKGLPTFAGFTARLGDWLYVKK